MLSRVWQWAVESEGSTRTAALLRMGLALIAWARFGSEVALFHDPSPARMALAIVFSVAATLMFVGWRAQWSTAATALVISAIYWNAAVRQGRSGYHHVYFLASAMWLVALMPCGRSLSVDRWRALRRGRAETERANLWPLRLLAIQVAAIYFFAAFDKTEWGYFTGERLEMFYLSVYGGARFPYEVPWFHAACVALAWGTVAIEYTLAFGLFVARWRLWLIAVGVVFHGVIYLTMSVYTFSVTMVLLYLAFVDPDEVHRRMDLLLGAKETGSR